MIMNQQVHTPHEPAITSITNKNFEMEYIHLKYVVASFIYSFIGVLILIICFVIVEKITPQNLWKEVVEKQNMALSIIAAAFIIAVAIIISSAIHG